MLDLTRLPTPEPVMEAIEDVEEFERTPREQQFPYSDSYNLISDSARRFGDDIALEFLLQGLPDEPSQSVSFAELSAQITRTANALHGLGIEVGGRGNVVWDKGLPLRGLGLLAEILLGLLDKLGTDKKFDRGHGLSFRSGGRAFVRDGRCHGHRGRPMVAYESRYIGWIPQYDRGDAPAHLGDIVRAR